MNTADNFLRIIIFLIIVFVVIQFIPYGKDHTNPPVVKEPSWDTPQTRELAKQYCFDCHSNETTWPWYSNIAPASWLVTRDVEEGRSNLNFSDCAASTKLDEAPDEISEGGMPPIQYTLIHPKPSDADRQALAQGLSNSPCK